MTKCHSKMLSCKVQRGRCIICRKCKGESKPRAGGGGGGGLPRTSSASAVKSLPESC